MLGRGSPTGCISSRAMLWVGGVLTLAVVVWPLAPDLRRAAFLRFSRIAIVLVGVLVLAGTFVAIERLPDRRRPLGDGLRADAARQARDRPRRAGMGWRSTTPSSARGSSAARRRGASGGACSARAPSRWPCCSSAAVLVNGAPPPVDDGTARPAAARPLVPGRLAAVVSAPCSSRSPAAPGFLGLHLARRLVADGHACGRSTSRRSTTRSSRAGSRSSAATSADGATRGGSSRAPTSLVHAAAALPIQASRARDPLGQRRGRGRRRSPPRSRPASGASS